MALSDFVLFVMEAGIKLKLTNVSITKAHLLCHEFKRCVSGSEYDMKMIAAAAVSIVIRINKEKVDPDAKLLLLYVMIFGEPSSDLEDEKVVEFKKTLHQVEIFLFKMLDGNVSHKVALQYLAKFLVCLQSMKKVENIFHAVSVNSFRLASDFYFTDKCLNYKPEDIAAGAIDVALYLSGFTAEEKNNWLKTFSASYFSSSLQIWQEMLKETEIDENKNLKKKS